MNESQWETLSQKTRWLYCLRNDSWGWPLIYTHTWAQTSMGNTHTLLLYTTHMYTYVHTHTERMYWYTDVAHTSGGWQAQEHAPASSRSHHITADSESCAWVKQKNVRREQTTLATYDPSLQQRHCSFWRLLPSALFSMDPTPQPCFTGVCSSPGNWGELSKLTYLYQPNDFLKAMVFLSFSET